MNVATVFLLFLISLQHFAFCVLEMFFWTKPLGRKIFGLDPDLAEKSRALAANQGLYNAFVAAGLLLPFFAPPNASLTIARFFLSCVVVAGAFGAFTVKPRIFFVQSVPALVALVVSFLF